jgi:hypothetical protein
MLELGVRHGHEVTRTNQHQKLELQDGYMIFFFIGTTDTVGLGLPL